MRTTLMTGQGVLGVLTSGCSSPATPAAGGLPLEVESVEVLQLESYPVQLILHVEGWLPNPCSTAGWEVIAGTPGEVEVELYGVPDGSEACIQVLAPFEVNIPLGAQAEGGTRIVVNGEVVAQPDGR